LNNQNVGVGHTTQSVCAIDPEQQPEIQNGVFSSEDYGNPDLAIRNENMLNEGLELSLRNWAKVFNISLRALSALLQILSVHPALTICKDARTILKTPKAVVKKR
jgi:hypothetical protein